MCNSYRKKTKTSEYLIRFANIKINAYCKLTFVGKIRDIDDLLIDSRHASRVTRYEIKSGSQQLYS